MRKGFNKLSLCAGGIAIIGFAAPTWATINIDGTLDSDYTAPITGQTTPLATQTVNTGFGDNTAVQNGGTLANGSELDAAYGLVQNGNLNLFLSGNVETNGNHLTIYFADGRAGQSTLTAMGGQSNTAALSGSKFSPDFSATYMLDMNYSNGNWNINSNDLTSSTGPETFVGSFIPVVGQTANLGGGIKVSFDNSNIAGVNGNQGTAADSTAADAVTTGFEFSIPMSFLGSPINPAVPIKVLADINGGKNDFLSNQFLPGLPVGSGNVNGGGKFDFSQTPGEYFTIAVPPPASTSAVWIGTTANTVTTGSWSDGTNNWSGGVPHLPADIATFGLVTNGAYNVHLDGDKTVGQLIFNSGNSYTIDAGSGGTLTIDDTGDTSGGIPSITVQTGSHSISAPIAFSANVTINTIATSALSISGNITGGTAGDGTTGFLIKKGDGALVLSGTNSFTGGLSIHAGSVEIDSSNSLTSTQNIFIGDGTVDNQLATLILANNNLNIATPIQTNVEQAFNNNHRAITATYLNGSSTLSGPIFLNGSVMIANLLGTNLTFTGVIQDGTDTNSSVTHDLTINGAGVVVLSNTETYSGNTNVNSGVLTLSPEASILSGGVNVHSSATFNVNGTFPGRSTTTGTIYPNVSVDGTGIIAFGQAPARILGGLNISGGTATLAHADTPASRTILTTAGLTFTGDAVAGWQGLLDLSNNDMIVQVGANTDINNITSQLKGGFAADTGGYWNGPGGIVSSAAANDSNHLTTLGVILNDNGASAPIYTTFGPGAGQPTSLDDVLVKYTYFGDANLDGTLNGADYQQIDNGFGIGLTGWVNGDFNYDGVVDGSDFALIDNTFNQITATGATPLALIASPATLSAVPEPGTLTLLGIGIAATLNRRRRRHECV